jgi:glucose-6-phosphate isomerase
VRLDQLDRLMWCGQDVGFTVDLSEALSVEDIDAAEPAFAGVFRTMAEIEGGAVGNPDEGRQVGHYWLRAPDLAPDGLGAKVEAMRRQCLEVAASIHRDGTFTDLLVLGIGGSALGPQLVSDALAEPDDRLRVHFLDNTDPEGLARVIGPLDLEATVVVCISKSGATPETRNALVEVEAAYERAGVALAPGAIAVSGEGSRLWQAAEGWRARIPMWDWVGGRTSVTSAVGILPMALQGLPVEEFLSGAAAMDVVTRVPSVAGNPAALLATAWHVLGEGRGRRAMVVLPYRDRLVLFSRYLQQLVMESLGKERDLAGNVVHQGLTVYGNKGSTDQHAYIQQLREGPDDYFATFVTVLDDGYYGAEPVEPGVDSGDYLQGLFLGTRRALADAGHRSIGLVLDRLDAFHLGALIALFERAVGLYALRVGVNAYHQPGVEAGKKAASGILALKAPLLAALGDTPEPVSILAERVGAADPLVAWYVLSRLAANDRGVVRERGVSPWSDRFARAPG